MNIVPDVGEVSRQLAQQAERVASFLLPNGKRKGNHWACGNVRGEEGDSLKVTLIGEHAGKWQDWATEEHGDLLDLWAASRGLDLSAALKEAKSYLGLNGTNYAPKPTVRLLESQRVPGFAGNAPKKLGNLSKVWEWPYMQDGKQVGVVARYEDGAGDEPVFPFFRPDGKAGIPEGLIPPLYGEIDPKYVFVVEGEKCADALRQMGLAAITSQGGSGAAGKADWGALAAVERVYLLPDNDPPGEKYIKTVAVILDGQRPGRELLRVDLPNLPATGDIVDWARARISSWDGYSKDERIAGLKTEFRELAKGAVPIEFPKPRSHDLVVRSASDVRPKAINWLWPERFGSGFLSIIAGPGGVGKSTIAVSMASIITRGGKWPFSDHYAAQGTVAWITGEESIEQQLTPRLMVAGADLKRVVFIEGVIREDAGEEQGGAPMRMSIDAQQIVGLKREHPDLRMLVIDPLSAFLDARDSHKEADVRQVFHPWVAAAEEAGVAVVFIAHHNKSKGGHVRDRLSGSTAIRNAVRVVYVALENPDADGEFLFLPEKSNLSDGQIPGLVYRIVGKDWTSGQASGNVACVEWQRETDQKANQVAAQESAGGQPIDDATEFLITELEDGQRDVSELKKSAQDAGIAWRTINRAKKKLNVRSGKKGFGTGWVWSLPSQHYQPSQTAKIATTAAKDASYIGGTLRGTLGSSEGLKTAPLSHSDEGCHMRDSAKDAKQVGTLREGTQVSHILVVGEGGNLGLANDPETDEVGFV